MNVYGATQQQRPDGPQQQRQVSTWLAFPWIFEQAAEEAVNAMKYRVHFSTTDSDDDDDGRTGV